MIVKIYVLVNNESTGLPSGKVTALHLEDDMMEITSLEGCRFRYLPEKDGVMFVRIGRIVFNPVSIRNNDGGNWLWDSIELDAKDAVRVLDYLRKHNWICESAWENLYEIWHSGKPFQWEYLATEMTYMKYGTQASHSNGNT
jgi:hypothetical protein